MSTWEFFKIANKFAKFTIIACHKQNIPYTTCTVHVQYMYMYCTCTCEWFSKWGLLVTMATLCLHPLPQMSRNWSRAVTLCWLSWPSMNWWAPQWGRREFGGCDVCYHGYRVLRCWSHCRKLSLARPSLRWYLVSLSLSLSLSLSSLPLSHSLSQFLSTAKSPCHCRVRGSSQHLSARCPAASSSPSPRSQHQASFPLPFPGRWEASV